MSSQQPDVSTSESQLDVQMASLRLDTPESKLKLVARKNRQSRANRRPGSSRASLSNMRATRREKRRLLRSRLRRAERRNRAIEVNKIAGIINNSRASRRSLGRLIPLRSMRNKPIRNFPKTEDELDKLSDNLVEKILRLLEDPLAVLDEDLDSKRQRLKQLTGLYD